MRCLQIDNRGLARWIEREARGMSENQMYREFVQNGIEAGATRIDIDGYTDPDTGRVLARITDNGRGMTESQLLSRLTTLHNAMTADNYGVGARIAALPANPHGVEFASRTAQGDQAVWVCKQNGAYGVRDDWYVDGVRAEVYGPAEYALSRIGDQESGTAVILHGSGKTDTYTSQTNYPIRRFLSTRYYDFGEVAVYIEHPDSDNPTGRRSRRVPSLSETLIDHAEDFGRLEFTDVAGMSGTLEWWIVPTATELKKTSGRADLPTGVAILCENEVFGTGRDGKIERTYSNDFGLYHAEVQKRVLLLVSPNGAEHNTARSAVILPGHSSIPWKKFGAWFIEHMPQRIGELVEEQVRKSRPGGIDAATADLLDDEWRKQLEPTAHMVSGGDQTGAGAKPGDGLERKRPAPRPGPGPRPACPAPRASDDTNASGDKPAHEVKTVVPPRVEFTDDWDFGDASDGAAGNDRTAYGIQWIDSSNVILIWTEMPPYVREVQRRQEQMPLVPATLIEQAVRMAYHIEYAAMIIDANVQRKTQLSPSQVEDLKTPPALYAKALGMQSMTERVAAYVDDYMKATVETG